MKLTTHGARYNGSRSLPSLSSRRRDVEFVLVAASVSRRVLALDAPLTCGVRPLAAATDDLDATAVVARDRFEIKAIVPGFRERAVESAVVAAFNREITEAGAIPENEAGLAGVYGRSPLNNRAFRHLELSCYVLNG